MAHKFLKISFFQRATRRQNGESPRPRADHLTPCRNYHLHKNKNQKRCRRRYSRRYNCLLNSQTDVPTAHCWDSSPTISEAPSPKTVSSRLSAWVLRQQSQRSSPRSEPVSATTTIHTIVRAIVDGTHGSRCRGASSLSRSRSITPILSHTIGQRNFASILIGNHNNKQQNNNYGTEEQTTVRSKQES